MPQCKNCINEFTVDDADLKFLDKISPRIGDQKFQMNEPTYCPDCRQIRRLSWRNERNLFKRKCDLCDKSTLSIYDDKADYTVYCLDCWWSDKWDAKDFGMEFDFDRSFFEQYEELQKKTPHMALLQSQNENSEYTNYVSHLKDCYLLFSSDFNQNCYYGVWVERSKDCVDNLMIDECELTYQSVFSQKIYNGIYVLNSSNCNDSSFLLDCKGCNNCFMSYNLRNKQYCILNKQYSKEEYFEKLGELNHSSQKELNAMKEQFFQFIKGAIYLNLRRNGRVIDSSGDFLTNVENCKECYELTDAKDCKYIQGGFELKDAQHSSYVQKELGYENCECVPMPFNSCFNMNSYSGSDMYYCDTCMNDNKNLFGCVGMKHQQNCIFNKEYSKEKYDEMIAKIIEHMKKTGEWGEFPPTKNSPFAYNDTNAQEYFPSTKEKVEKWRDPDPKEHKPQTYEISDDIKDVPDSITNELLACDHCGKNYKIIQQELEFYKKMNLPIPHDCFDCRHAERVKLKNPRHLNVRKCYRCAAEVETTYLAGEPEKVLCEKCYLEEVV
jgi:hypothetical protein